MFAEFRLAELPGLHPRLLWYDVVSAAAAMLSRKSRTRIVSLPMTFHQVPGFGTQEVEFRIDFADMSRRSINRLRRTYESHRIVELAAIAIAGLALYYGGRHEISDIALRGTGADYLVDQPGYLLEVAGRSRRASLEPAWTKRVKRLRAAGGLPCFLCVVEFETPAGRLGFLEE